MIQPYLKSIFRYQILITVVTTVAFAIATTRYNQVLSFLLGSTIMTLNFYSLGLIWKRVFEKKPVAITLGLIITKYTVLALLLFYAIKKWQIELIPLVVGLSTMMGSFLLLALEIYLSEKKK
jgi:hypothetical protein